MDEFETLLASGKTAVERWVRARTSRPADAEDILQEIYLAAFQSFSGLRNHNAFLPWILSIAKRKYADWYRAQTRRREIPMDQLPEKAEETPEELPVEETLNALPERDRLMLRLFYQEMLSQKQISARLNIPEGTVKSRMNTARDRFRTAYPCPPKGDKMMKKNFTVLPDMLPEYSITWKKDPVFPVDCEELTGWFIVPKEGEKITWGMYDLPSRKLDISYEMAVTGPASVHGLEGVAITAKVIQPKSAVSSGDPMQDAVEASCGGREEWKFVAQEKDGYTRFLSAEHLEDGKSVLTTFLDGKDFMDNWGFGDDNIGTCVRLKPEGKIQRKGSVVTTGENKPFRDVAGRCEVTLDGVAYNTVCLMDFGMYDQGTLSEQFIGRDGRTVLWRRFNRDNWAIDRYGKRWSELLPENEQLTVNGELFVHWYDCLIVNKD